jgi:hypothetical protein
MHREYGARGLAILAVNIREDRRTVESWVKQAGVTFRVLLDPRGDAVAAYRVTGTPTVVLIGRDGRLVARGVGTREWTGEAGRALLAALLKAPGGSEGSAPRR